MGSALIGHNELQLTGSGVWCAENQRRAEQDAQKDAAEGAQPGSHIIRSTPRGRRGGGRRTATGDGPGETGHRASATATTAAGNARPRRGALSFSQSPSNPGEVFASPGLNQLTSALPVDREKR